LPFGRVKEDTVFLDFLDGGIVKDLYAAFLDTVNNVGTDPVLDPGSDLWPTDDQTDLGPFSPTLQGRINGRVARPDHRQFLTGVKMGILVIMGYLGQILPGDAQGIGQIVETGSYHDIFGPVSIFLGLDVEGVPFFFDREDPFKELDV